MGLLHHGHEFIEIDFPATVGIDLPHNIIDTPQVHGIAESILLQHGAHLLLRNLTIAIAIEQTESAPADVLLYVKSAVERGSQELSVIDCATTIRVHLLHHLLQVRRDFEIRSSDALLDLGDAELPITVAIQRHEKVPEVFDL